MEAQGLNLSQVNVGYVNSGYNVQEPVVLPGEAGPTNPIAQNKDDKEKKLKLALAGLAAVGITAVAIGIGAKHKFNVDEAKRFFDKYLQATAGNNKVVAESVGETKAAADKFMSEHPDICESIKKYISSVAEPRTLEEIGSDGLVYHGTSVDTAKKILGEGISPYASKVAANKVPGLGRGVYTTPTLDLAKYYSENGVILPYKLEGQVGELKVDIDEFRAMVSSIISSGIEPDAKDTILGKMYSSETMQTAMDYTADVINKLAQDSGYVGFYTPKGMTTGLLSGVFGKLPENLDSAGQLAVYDGAKLTLDIDKLKELNPITKDNYSKFLG